MSEEHLSLEEKLKLFLTSKPTKELLHTHATLLLIGITIYLTLDLLALVGFVIVASLSEMLVFHVLWIYRDNKDKTLQFAIKTELINIAIAVIFLVIFLTTNIVTSTVLNAPTLIPTTILLLILFFGTSAYKVYTARIPREAVNDKETVEEQN